MKNSKSVFQELVSRISIHSNREEVESIAYLVLDDLFSLTKTQIMSGKEIMLSGNQLSHLQEVVDRINKQEPVQYVLGKAEFYRRNFIVNRSVLIPRPETEELVRLVIGDLKQRAIQHPKILDIGTGSGCIAITLAAEINHAIVIATDISESALKVARENNRMANNRVQLIRHDILTEQLPVDGLDVVVSNPPYIAEREVESMNGNVVQYEPHLALFVPDNDPLRFYRSIAWKAMTGLSAGGFVIAEINESFGKETAMLFTAEGFTNVMILKDLSGKQRFVKATKR